MNIISERIKHRSYDLGQKAQFKIQAQLDEKQSKDMSTYATVESVLVIGVGNFQSKTAN